MVSRSILMALRLAQFICAAVVLGLTSYFLHLEHKHSIGPFGRLYSAIIAAVSLATALFWLVPSTAIPLAHVIADLLFCGAWFAVFGLLQDWYADAMHCGSTWDWDEMSLRNGLCGKWNAAQAFAFMAAILWFISFIMGVLAWKRHGATSARGPTAAAGGGTAAPATTTGLV